MKSKLVLSLGLLAVPFALRATSPESAYVETYRGRTDIPVPLSVVMPRVMPRFAGQQVVLTFVVDTTGQPTCLTSATPGASRELVDAVKAAVAQWRFSPALRAGQPVARRVMLPVNIDEGIGEMSGLAMQ